MSAGRVATAALLDALSALADRSLLIADATDPPRYHLLETTRAYALEKLAAAGETEAWIVHHLRGVCEVFERIDAARYGEQGTISNVELVRRCGPEIDNARTALDGAEAEPGELDLAVGLTAAMVAALWSLADSAEALNRVMRVAARLDDSVSPLRASRLRLRLAAMGPMGRVPLMVVLDAADRAERYYQSQALPRGRWDALRCKADAMAARGDWRSAQACCPLCAAWKTRRGPPGALQSDWHWREGLIWPRADSKRRLPCTRRSASYWRASANAPP